MAGQYTVFQRYLAESLRYWRGVSTAPAPDAPVILVDLMVDHPQYYLANLVVAKHLQRLSGARLVGFVDNRGHEKAVLTAKSFGVDTVHAVNDAATAALAADLAGHAARLRPLDGSALRRAVLDLDCDGLPIGDLVYDSYLRGNRRATIETCDNALLLEVSLGLNTVRFLRGVLDGFPRIEAAVVGHDCYVLYGALYRLAEARGAEVHLVTKRKFAANVQRYSALPKDERFRMRIPPARLDAVWAGRRAEAAARGKAIIADRMAGVGGRHSGLTGGYDPRNALVPVPALFGRPADAKRERPLIGVMATSLADAPHANARNVYDDQYVWLEESLKIARDMPETDWVFKLHPYTGLYVDRSHLAALVERYADGTPHIRLIPETANARSLVGAIDGLITPWGTGGLEFATLGVPVVTTGNTFYSGLGFAEEVASAGEYRAAIAALPHRASSPDAAERARVAAWLFFEDMLSDCALLPDVEMQPWVSFDETALWQEAADRLAACRPGDDPLFRRIERYQAEGAVSI